MVGYDEKLYFRCSLLDDSRRGSGRLLRAAVVAGAAGSSGDITDGTLI